MLCLEELSKRENLRAGLSEGYKAFPRKVLLWWFALFCLVWNLTNICGFCSYQKEIEDLLAANPDFIKPESRRNEVMGWVKSGLQDFSLSRAKNDWGIRVPWDSTQTFYVWTDALMGYMTGNSLIIIHDNLYSGVQDDKCRLMGYMTQCLLTNCQAAHLKSCMIDCPAYT